MANTSTETVEAQFLAAYETYADAIFRFCLVKTSDREVAADLMQEAFTRVWEYTQNGGEIQTWKSFLFRTANNLIIDHYRKKKSGSLDKLEEDVGFLPVDEHTMDAQKQAEVSRALELLDTLEKAYRDPVYFRFVEGLTPRDIAAIMDVSENVVSVRIHRGIAQLREKLAATKHN